MQGYTTGEAAELLGLSPAQIRSFARAGLIAPQRGRRGEYRLSFQDIVLLRTAKGLLEAAVPMRRVRQSLRRVLGQLPRGRPLSTVRVRAEGDRVVVRDAGVSWHPESGQTVLDFEVSELASRLGPAAARIVHEALDEEPAMDAEDWYGLGTELEAVSAAQARAAYERALSLDPDHVDARVNLGRLCQEDGDRGTAEACYRAALAADARHAVAAFNLGTVLEDRAQRDEAIAAYRIAIEIDPGFTDAHFNLARLYESAGRRDAALRHLRSYRALTS